MSQNDYINIRAYGSEPIPPIVVRDARDTLDFTLSFEISGPYLSDKAALRKHLRRACHHRIDQLLDALVVRTHE